MTQAQPPAAPAAPPASTPAAPNPGAGQPPGFGDAQQAAADRLAAAFPEGLQPGTPADVAAAATAAPEATDFWAEDADEKLIPDNMQYRDAVELRGELKKARETYRPFRDAFGQLDEAERNAVMAAAPTLGSDLAQFSQIAPNLHPDDRAYMMQAMQLMGDPATVAAGAEMLANAATILRGETPAPTQAQAPFAPLGQPDLTNPAAWADPNLGQQLPPEQQPMTRADFAAMMQERDNERQVQDSESQILAKARELGYDPDATDPIADGRFRTFIAMAARPEVDGDLDRAHSLMEQMDQATIDKFVQAKSADADRPGAPAMGATPADTRVLDTMTDARGAAEARIAAALGPDPRRRGDD